MFISFRLAHASYNIGLIENDKKKTYTFHSVFYCARFLLLFLLRFSETIKHRKGKLSNKNRHTLSQPQRQCDVKKMDHENAEARANNNSVNIKRLSELSTKVNRIFRFLHDQVQITE